MSKLAVVAIGGNSLIKDGKKITVKDHYEACLETAGKVLELIRTGYRIVVTHGNGPQVGFVLRRCELARKEVPMLPLDSCVSNTQGGIGYLLQLAFNNVFRDAGIKKNVATVVTQVVVSAQDPAFQNPSKPIGFFLTQKEAEKHQKEDGWNIMEDAGRGYRRVVPSPIPQEILEIEAIKALAEKDVLVIAAGGCGIPVVIDDKGHFKGVEAVVDKDHASSLLAKTLGADYFVVSTAVEKVCLNFGKSDEKKLDSMTIKEAEQYIKEKHFAPGSMLPKVKAVMNFVRATGGVGVITDPEHIYQAVHLGKAGTRIMIG
ncbi:MAG: carbamate kinase [Pseudomonadota bacterium]